MKRFFASMAGAVLLAGIASAADEIAFVDMEEVFKRFYKTHLAQDQMRQQADDIKAERERVEEDVTAMKEKIEELRADSRDEALSEEVRRNKRNQLEAKLVELQKAEQDLVEFEQLRKKQMEQQNARMTRKLYDEIRDAVVVYAKAQGFSAVLDRSSQSRLGTQTVLFVAPKVDVTAQVLAVLNEGRGRTGTAVKDEPDNEE